MKTTLKFGRKRQPQTTKDEPADNFDDFDEVDDDDYGDELELLLVPPALSRRLAARRAIELAREELALMRELEDYPEH